MRIEIPSMQFDIRIDRHTCFFYFIHNMAGWHHSCAPYFNEVWIRETGELSPGERDALDAFAGLAREYTFGDRWIGKPFVLAASMDEALAGAKELAGPTGEDVLRSAFSALTLRFDDIWHRDEPRLHDFGQHIATELSSEGVERALSMARRYLQSSPQPVTVHLLLSRGAWGVGGANEGPGHVTLATMEKPETGPAIEVLVHEAIHLMEEPAFNPMFRQFCNSRGVEDQAEPRHMSPYHLLKEAFTGALLPGGCLSPVLGNACYDFDRQADYIEKRQGDSDRAALARLTGRILHLVSAYVKEGRPADQGLLEQAYEIFVNRPLH